MNEKHKWKKTEDEKMRRQVSFQTTEAVEIIFQEDKHKESRKSK